MQTYDRTLTGQGMALRFVRISNGEEEQRILAWRVGVGLRRAMARVLCALSERWFFRGA